MLQKYAYWTNRDSKKVQKKIRVPGKSAKKKIEKSCPFQKILITHNLMSGL